MTTQKSVILRVAAKIDQIAFQTWHIKGVRSKDTKISAPQKYQQFKAICAAAEIVDLLTTVSKSDMDDALKDLLNSEMFTENGGAAKKWLTFLS